MIILKNNAQSILAQSVSETDTHLYVTDISAFPEIQSPGEQWFRLALSDNAGNLEFVKVTDRVDDALIVERGEEDTPALPWPAGARVQLRMTAKSWSEMAGRIAEGTLTLEDLKRTAQQAAEAASQAAQAAQQAETAAQQAAYYAAGRALRVHTLDAALPANEAYPTPEYTAGRQMLTVALNGVLIHNFQETGARDEISASIMFDDDIPVGTEITVECFARKAPASDIEP